MLRTLAAGALAAGILLAAAVPAGAQVTKNPKKATDLLPCNDGSGRTALVWFTPDARSWAVDNRPRGCPSPRRRGTGRGTPAPTGTPSGRWARRITVFTTCSAAQAPLGPERLGGGARAPAPRLLGLRLVIRLRVLEGDRVPLRVAGHRLSDASAGVSHSAPHLGTVQSAGGASTGATPACRS